MRGLLLFGVVLLAGCAVVVGTAINEDAKASPGAMAVRPPREMAPDRKVSEQDCSKPVDHSLGNVRCK